MIILTGNSLNAKHQELNKKVNEAAINGVPFNNIESQLEKTDIDRLFKIDLANKYKHLDYIIDTLKCGDSLYVTRALKCQWLYNGEFSHIINPDYLDQHIFPEMSRKMRQIFLKTIAQQVTNDERAALFFTYCLKILLPFIAIKFLLHTSEAFKLDVIKGNSLHISDKDMINIISNSFVLASTALELQKHKTVKHLRHLSYLYSVSEEGYLALIEKYILDTPYSYKRLGLRISKHITRHYKERILSHPQLYLNMLNVKMTIKYTTTDDIKKIIAKLMPSQCSEFWGIYKQYKYLTEAIPILERLKYIKEIYSLHYPNEIFEMNIQFFHSGLYKLLSKDERESWALEHIKEGLEHFGNGQDFKWYQFVSFEKAFEPIKKYILVATNPYIRTSVIKVLVSIAQTERDLHCLFNYYYQRFVNEIKHHKEIFVNEVLRIHNCYEFDEDCWNALNKILHSMDVYDSMITYSCKSDYKLIAIIYSILHKKQLHDALKCYIDSGINLYNFKQHTNKLPNEEFKIVYQYMFHYYISKIISFDIEDNSEEVRDGIKKYIHNLLQLMKEYNRPEKELPEIIMKLIITLNITTYRYFPRFKEEKKPFTQHVLIKDLKKDASIAASKIPLLKEKLKKKSRFNLNILLRKIRLYFSTDIAYEYIKLFKELLAIDELHEKTIDAAVYGFLHLAEIDDRVDFVTKYIPTEPKIDHEQITRKVLYIRIAICKFICISRPIIPLFTAQKYIVGDYLKFCLPLFQSFSANLPPATLIEFVNFLLKSPASIQKHGIRMAFQCFNIIDLIGVASNLWKNTKNISLRLVIYMLVHDKILKERDVGAQSRLFEVLKMFTLDIREDDDSELFALMLTTSLPNHILGEHILCTWQVLNKFPCKPYMIGRQSVVMGNMAKHMGLIKQDVIESIIREYITIMFKEGQIKSTSKNEQHIKDLNNAKWKLTANYIMHLPSKELLEEKLTIVETIIKECVRLWNHIEDGLYVVRLFLLEFLTDLKKVICYKETNSCFHGIVILEKLIKLLQDALPLVEVYDAIWYLRLSIIVANIMADGIYMFNEKGSESGSLIFTQSINKFATEFINLVNEFIEKNIYFSSAIYIIRKVLSNIYIELLFYWPFEVSYNKDYIFFTICSELVKTDNIETYKLALAMWPSSYKEQMSVDFINKLKSSDNVEIKYLLYRFLVSGTQLDKVF